MLKLYRITKVKMLFLVLVYVFNFNLFEFSAAILEKGLFHGIKPLQVAPLSEKDLLLFGRIALPVRTSFANLLLSLV